MKTTFTTQLRASGESEARTLLEVPFDVAQVFGSKGRVAVKGTINGFAFRTSIFPQGDGTHCLLVNRAMQAGAKAQAGDIVEVVIEPDTAPRQVEVPSDLKRALANNPRAKAAFEKLPYSHRKEYVDWITEAKKPETRAARIDKTVKMCLAEKGRK